MQQIKYLISLSYGLILSCLVTPLLAMESDELPNCPENIRIESTLCLKSIRTIALLPEGSGKVVPHVGVNALDVKLVNLDDNTQEDFSASLKPQFIPVRSIQKYCCNVGNSGYVLHQQIQVGDVTNENNTSEEPLTLYAFTKNNTFVEKLRIDLTEGLYYNKKSHFIKDTCNIVPAKFTFVSRDPDKRNDPNAFADEFKKCVDEFNEIGKTGDLGTRMAPLPNMKARTIKNAKNVFVENMSTGTFKHGDDCLANKPAVSSFKRKRGVESTHQFATSTRQYGPGFKGRDLHPAKKSRREYLSKTEDRA